MKPLVKFAWVLAALAGLTQAGMGAAQEGSWKGQLVINTKRQEEIKITSVVDDQNVERPFSGRWPLLVIDDQNGKLLLNDKVREGWVKKEDFVLSREALEHFQKLVEAKPDDEWALFMRGSSWSLRGNQANAIKDFSACIKLNPKNAASWANRGNALKAIKEFDKAIGDYDEANRLAPNFAPPYFNRGVIWLEKKLLDRALREFDDAIRNDFNFTDAYFQRGFVRTLKTDYDGAIKDFDQAIRREPKAALAYARRGDALSLKREYDKAIADFSEVIRLQTKLDIAHYSRGLAYTRLKNYERALSDFDESIRHNPNFLPALHGRGVTLMLARKPGAAASFQSFLDRNGLKGNKPLFAVIQGNLAARQAGDADTAKKFLSDSAGKLDEAWPYPVVQFLRGEIDEAALLKLADDKGKETEARCYLGLDQSIQSKPAEAKAHLRWVKLQGEKTFTEHQLALVELERLDPHGADEAPFIKTLVERMPVEGKEYDPQPLLEYEVAGVRAVMDQVFPETAGGIGAERAKIEALVEELGAPTFGRREEASVALRQLGLACAGVLRQNIDHEDREVRSRVRKLLEALEKESASPNTNLALKAYLSKLKEVECQQELARRVTKALEARLDLTPKQDALKICLEAMTQWRTNRVHGELLPLLKLEDPAPAIFAMRQISGRTGNNYVSAIHMGAITSDRPELIRCGHRSMPSPVWDEDNKPKIKAALERYFDGSEVPAELRDDEDFIFSNASVAARDFQIVKARKWLIARIKGDDKQKSIRALHSLADSYYMRQPLDPELLAALEPHLKSEDPKLRAAAVRTLGAYRAEATHPLLVKAFADPVKEVWQTAGEGLSHQHAYYPKASSPIPKLLESALETNENPLERSRLDFLLKHLRQEKYSYLKWPE